MRIPPNSLIVKTDKHFALLAIILNKQLPVVTKATTTSSVPPSRQGKKAIAGHFDLSVSKQLKQIVLNHGMTVQALLTEAMNDLFIKYKRNPIA